MAARCVEYVPYSFFSFPFLRTMCHFLCLLLMFTFFLFWQ
jgi:hypothetical protein